MTLLLVLVGAAVGAPLRYLTDRAVQTRHDTLFPWGTFTVNVVGSLVLGVLAGGVTAGAVPGSAIALVGTGFCGALTRQARPQRGHQGHERDDRQPKVA
jgi:CrcB protein